MLIEAKLWWYHVRGCTNEFDRKICPVCGNKFEVEERLVDRKLYCTLRCCLKADEDRPERIMLKA